MNVMLSAAWHILVAGIASGLFQTLPEGDEAADDQPSEAPKAPKDSSAPAEAVAPGPATSAETTPKPTGPQTGFDFGSYGRVGVGTDLRGSTAESVNVVAHGTRVVELSYV